MEATPETAMSWYDVVQTTGVTGVLLGLVVFIGWLTPRFLKRWEDHTTALTKIAERLGAIERDLDNKNP